MTIAEYNIGDVVEVLMNNPRNDNKDEWRSAEVINKKTIFPAHGYKHRPYPILIVRVIRTYCKPTPIIEWIGGDIPVYKGSTLEFYDKENEEGVLYENKIRLKS